MKVLAGPKDVAGAIFAPAGPQSPEPPTQPLQAILPSNADSPSNAQEAGTSQDLGAGACTSTAGAHPSRHGSTAQSRCSSRGTFDLLDLEDAASISSTAEREALRQQLMAIGGGWGCTLVSCMVAVHQAASSPVQPPTKSTAPTILAAHAPSWDLMQYAVAAWNHVHSHRLLAQRSWHACVGPACSIHVGAELAHSKAEHLVGWREAGSPG